MMRDSRKHRSAYNWARIVPPDHVCRFGHAPRTTSRHRPSPRPGAAGPWCPMLWANLCRASEILKRPAAV